MNQRHKHYDIIVAWAEGKEIQFKSTIDGLWRGCRDTPGFLPNREYRVKPVIIKFRLALVKYDSVMYGGTKFIPVAVTYEEQQHEPREKWNSFVRWITDWQEVEVETPLATSGAV